jgi:hypothetical protein
MNEARIASMSITGEKSSYPLDSSDVFSCYSQGQVDTKYVQSCKGYLVDNKVTKLDRRKLLSTLFEVQTVARLFKNL